MQWIESGRSYLRTSSTFTLTGTPVGGVPSMPPTIPEENRRDRDGEPARTDAAAGPLRRSTPKGGNKLGAEETRCRTGGPDAESASSWRLRSAET
jgi:hypothetical protein